MCEQENIGALIDLQDIPEKYPHIHLINNSRDVTLVG